ncbi:hypothetical protein JHK85_050772 [Glycine max]|nr:hypothetical protein JHK85_050772 [Glycine max]
MESVSTLVDGDMVPSNEEIVFECPSDPKVISISENMSLAALRKKNFNANRGQHSAYTIKRHAYMHACFFWSPVVHEQNG